jgi:hypothetical protein
LIFAVNIFSSFPTGPDSLVYHLPLALSWLQSGSLAIPASKEWQLSLPGNAEIGMMIFLATGRQVAVVLVNCIATTTLAIATYLLAKRMSPGSRLVAPTVTLLLLSIPIVEFQTFSAYVDLFGTAFLMAGFALLVYRGGNDQDPQPGTYDVLVFLSALACGISIGTKPIYYLYGAVECMLALFWVYRDLSVDRTKLARAVLLTVVGVLLPCAFWFCRAAEATRNPVFPMRVSVGNHVLFDGYMSSQITDPTFDENFVRSRTEWLIYPWTEWKRHTGYLLVPYGEGNGVGAAFASLVMVGVAFLAFCAFAQPKPDSSYRKLLLVLVVSLLVWWFVMHRVPRFGLPILVLACVMSAPFIEVLQSSRRQAFAVLLVGSIGITCAISSFVPLHMLMGRMRTRKWGRAEFYGYPRTIDELPAGSRVLNYTKEGEENFALAGADLRNQVIPSFEVPSQITPEFLVQHKVDFLAETISGNDEVPAAPLRGAISLFSAQAVDLGSESIHWRIWKVEKPSHQDSAK